MFQEYEEIGPERAQLVLKTPRGDKENRVGVLEDKLTQCVRV
jgi:hypothetical protein